MHFPLTSLVMGEAVGEADFATRLVDDTADVGDEDGGEEPKTEEEMIVEGFRVTVKKGTEDPKFSRKKGSHGGFVTEKRAWVVSPGNVAH